MRIWQEKLDKTGNSVKSRNTSNPFIHRYNMGTADYQFNVDDILLVMGENTDAMAFGTLT
jgi:hypothetical protein